MQHSNESNTQAIHEVPRAVNIAAVPDVGEVLSGRERTCIANIRRMSLVGQKMMFDLAADNVHRFPPAKKAKVVLKLVGSSK